MVSRHRFLLPASYEVIGGLSATGRFLLGIDGTAVRLLWRAPPGLGTHYLNDTLMRNAALALLTLLVLAFVGIYPTLISEQGRGMGYAMRTDRYRFVEWRVPDKD